jgi:hypothetical protein
MSNRGKPGNWKRGEAISGVKTKVEAKVQEGVLLKLTRSETPGVVEFLKAASGGGGGGAAATYNETDRQTDKDRPVKCSLTLKRK